MSYLVARTEDLVVETLDHETLIYDAAAGMAHTLDPIATRIWHACDGSRTATDIARDTRCPGTHVVAALAQLQDLGLVVTVTSRREPSETAPLVGGSLAIGLPIIRTIAAPRSAQHST